MPAADEVIRDGLDEAEANVRLNAMLRRSDRDLYVHPSTRLPGRGGDRSGDRPPA